MPNKIIKRLVLAALVAAAAVVLYPSGAAAPTKLGPIEPVAASGATSIVFSPATNPAFKVDGYTSCAPGRTGHLWSATTITATSVFNPATDEVVVTLGGNSYSLLAGFVAKLSEGLGRSRASDGAVTLVIAFNDRKGLDDSRAIAMSFANAVVDPAVVTKDLSPARDAIRKARQAALETPNQALDMAPLIPWLPRNAVKGIVNSLFAYSEDVPVSCSNMGELPPIVGQIDGTDADYLLLRGADQNVTEREMERSNGQLVIVSGRINGKISISVEAYQPRSENSKRWLREIAQQTLTDFGLTGVIE